MMLIPVAEPRIVRFECMAFGMFIHWGLYSQLGQGEWIQLVGNISKDEYAKLIDTFTASEFDAKQIVRTAKKAGMRYITMTTRHHEGFSLYDTKGLSEFDVMRSPAGRDLVAEFVQACRDEGIVPMLYHTTLDWYQDSYKNDFPAYLQYLYNSVEILCTQYGDIGGFWFDGNWDKPDADWELDALYGMIRSYQPQAMIINNTGIQYRGELGHPEIDSVTFEQGRPEPLDRTGMTKYVSAEMCETLNEHWGIGYRDLKYKSTGNIIESMCACRKVGANYLLNIGPKAEGNIVKMQEALLEVIGEWMDVFGTAIYEGKPTIVQGKHKDFALESEDGKLYLFIHDLGIRGNEHVTIGDGSPGNRMFSGLVERIRSIRWLDCKEELQFEQDTDAGTFTFIATGYPYGVNYVVRVAEVRLGSGIGEQ